MTLAQSNLFFEFFLEFRVSLLLPECFQKTIKSLRRKTTRLRKGAHQFHLKQEEWKSLKLERRRCNRKSNLPGWERLVSHSIIFVTTPVPTVRLPSLSVNLSPCSRAISNFSAIVKVASSPGMINSFPSGRVIVAATSPVLTYIWGW